jgi:hypothetical protein
MTLDDEEDVVIELLRKASDHDPNRLHAEMWPAIEELAAREGIEIPPPLVTKTFTLELTARFPAHGEFEHTLAKRFHEVIANEYMKGGSDLMGYEGPFIERIITRGPGAE